MYDPKHNHQSQTIFLTKDNSAYVIIQHIPEDLKTYALANFDSLFNIHPDERANVLLFNHNTKKPDWKEITKPRWSQSYLNTPKFDNSVMKSYMFSGHNTTNNNSPIPPPFDPFYAYMKTQDDRYNQLIANWYDNNDYIPLHSDCESKMVPNHVISLINLNEDDNNDDEPRYLKFIARDRDQSIHNEFNIALRHGTLIIMGGDCQNKFSHGVLQNSNHKKRISLSFRQF